MLKENLLDCMIVVDMFYIIFYLLPLAAESDLIKLFEIEDSIFSV